MRRFSDLISPASWFFLALFSYPALFILFRPGLKGFLAMLLVDTLALVIAQKLETWAFRKMHPECDLFFPDFNEEAIAALSPARTQELFEDLVRLPWKRAVHLVVSSIPKVLPVAMLAVFSWKHPGISNWSQLWKFYAYELVILSYFCGAVYLDHHEFISRKIAELHAKLDWSEVFKTAKYPNNRWDFALPENLCLVSILAAVVICQAFILLLRPDDPLKVKTIDVVSFGLLGMIALARLWYMARSHFMKGLEHLFNTFESLDYHAREITIPLHSSRLLARFERTFNELTERLKTNERELSEWLIVETERSRFRDLGEITGLVAHDLATPLHVLQFCACELGKDTSRAQNSKYIEYIRTNAAHAIELIESLRAYLKNPSVREASTKLGDAHRYVSRLLRTQFHGQAVSGVPIEVEPAALEARLAASQPDLVHILFNVYRNSFTNMIEHSTPDPRVVVSLGADLADAVDLRISDSGSGLSAEEFERMTAFRFFPKGSPEGRAGLGLRLTRRLVERLGGSMQVVETALGTSTTISVILPKAAESPGLSRSGSASTPIAAEELSHEV